jgi:hypothetical protein
MKPETAGRPQFAHIANGKEIDGAHGAQSDLVGEVARTEPAVEQFEHQPIAVIG